MSKLELSTEELKGLLSMLNKHIQENDNLDFIKGYRESNQVVITYNEKQNPSEYDEKIREILDSPFISRRIAYNLAVYLKCKELFTIYDKQDPINEAFNIISKLAGISLQSVQDKAYRQIQLNSQSYRRYIIEALNGNNQDIKQILLNNVGRNTSDYDEKIVKETIK